MIERRWVYQSKINEDDIVGSRDEDDIVRSGDVDDNIKPQPQSPDIEDSVDHNGWLLNQHPAYDRLLNAQVQLQLREEHITGKIRRRAL